MKMFNNGLIVITAAIATTLQAKAGSSVLPLGTSGSVSDSLSTSIYQNADTASSFESFYQASQSSTFVGAGTGVSSFSTAAVGTPYNNNYPTETLKLPEPTTLTLSTLGGLTALLFLRRFGKGSKTHKA